MKTPSREWTPRQIVAELDEYVIGQNAAKRAVAVAMRNRLRRRLAPEDIREEIMPGNILMIGPTGVGKTEIARRLARIAGAPFLKVEASKFTEVGYVGRDVESIIRDLVEISISIVRREMSCDVETRAEKQVEERLMNLLLPRSRRRALDAESGEPGRWQEERARLRRELRSGRLNDRILQIDVTASRPLMGDLMAQLGMDESDATMNEALEQFFPSRKKRRRVPLSEARQVFMQEETARMVDRDEMTRQALERAQSSGIVFLDEVDKICSTQGSRQGPEVSREGVQRDLLPILEGSTVATKHGLVRTDHILFIAAGAFHMVRPSDLVPELQGRLPIRVELQALKAADFLRILREPRNSLVRQYQALVKAEGTELEFTDGALELVAQIADTVNAQTENIGARRLQTVLNTLLEEVLFDLPEAGSGRILVDEEMVEKRLGSISRDKDLSRYIL